MSSRNITTSSPSSRASRNISTSPPRASRGPTRRLTHALTHAVTAQDPEMMQIHWISKTGVPHPELHILESLAASAKRKLPLHEVKRLCAEKEDCIGFAYKPDTKAWVPKSVTGSPALATATFHQPKLGEHWEFHYIRGRDPACLVNEEPGGPRLRVWVEGVEGFPHVRQRQGCCSCCVPQHRRVQGGVSMSIPNSKSADGNPTSEGTHSLSYTGMLHRLLHGTTHTAEDKYSMMVCGWQEESGDAVFHFEEDSPFEVPLEGNHMVRFDARHLVGRHRRRGTLLGMRGYTEIPLQDLARQKKWRLMLFVESKSAMQAPDEALYGTDRPDEDPHDVRRPALIRVRTEVVGAAGFRQQDEPDFIPRWRPAADFEPRVQERRHASDGKKRVMLITRGTRGDVQPFVALARGLCLPPFNCEVTIVTELCNKEFVKKGRIGLPPGSLRFRPSGGNTPKYLEGMAQQLIMSYGQDIDLIQSLFLAMAESTMFNSEGACFYWAAVERPDFIAFGFNMCHIAMIISEALEIPLVGFFLQPCRKVEKRQHALSFVDEVLLPYREKINGQVFNAVLSQVFDQVNTTGESLHNLRKSRGLTPTPTRLVDEDLHFKELQEQGVPMVVPIHSVMVKGHVQEGMTYTDFIFLRLSNDSLSSDVSTFIDNAKGEGRQVGIMTFSSMPIGLKRMLDVAFEVVEKASAPAGNPTGAGKQPALIVMGAGQDVHDKPTEEQLAKVQGLLRQNRLLLLLKGQPFGALFPRLDFAIMHGGLGVTSEALLAGLPIITSGIQLLDQRWWGARMMDLGCGSAGIPFVRLLRKGESGKTRVSEQLDLALDRRTSSVGKKTWHQNVMEMRQRIAPRSDDPDGVFINAKAVFEAGAGLTATKIEAAYEEHANRQHCVQARCCYRTLRGSFKLLCLQMPMAFGSACYSATRRCCHPKNLKELAGMQGTDAGFANVDGLEPASDSEYEGSSSESESSAA